MNSRLLPRLSSLVCAAALAAGTGFLQAQNATAGSAESGTVTGGSVTGGSVTGGSVTGSSVTGATVTGGSVTGGSVTGGTVTGGTATAGKVTSGTVGPATATATVNGREITARSTESVSIQANGTNAVVNVGDHKLVLEKDRVMLDGQERGKLGPSVEKIAIDSANGKLTVRADGSEVLSADIGQKK